MPRYGDLTRRDLRSMLSSRVGDNIESTTTGNGTATSLLDSTRLEGSLGLAWKPGNYVYFPTGNLAGLERLVGSFVWGSLMTFQPAAPTLVGTGVVYELHNYPVRTYNDALKRAESRLRPLVWLDEMVELMWTQDAFEMSLGPTVLDSVYDVQLYDSYRTIWYSVEGPYKSPKWPVWRVVPGQNPRLQFFANRFTQPGTGATIRIYGQRRPSLMALDSDTCEIEQEWVLDLAEMEVHLARDTGSKDSSQRTARGRNAWDRFILQKPSMVGPKPNSIAFRPSL